MDFLYVGKPRESMEPGFCSLVALQKVKGQMRKRGFINVKRISDGAKFRVHRVDLVPEGGKKR